ncbi:MAG: MoaD/ThiS family protein [Gemmatimonadota bacterium]
MTVRIPTPLRECCAGATELPIEASSVAEVLSVLERDYPMLHVRVCDETGAIRRHVNVFVNRSHVRDLDGLSSELESGDVLTIMQAVSGG